MIVLQKSRHFVVYGHPSCIWSASQTRHVCMASQHVHNYAAAFAMHTDTRGSYLWAECMLCRSSGTRLTGLWTHSR